MLIAVQMHRTLGEVTEADRARIGGKAYNCARLMQAGIPVPDGIVVAADALLFGALGIMDAAEDFEAEFS